MVPSSAPAARSSCWPPTGRLRRLRAPHHSGLRARHRPTRYAPRLDAAAGALPAVPLVRGPLALRVVYPPPDARRERARLQLPLRLGRNRRRHAHDQRPPGAGLAQRRLARLGLAAARQPHALQHRRAHRRRTPPSWTTYVRRARLPAPPRGARAVDRLGLALAAGPRVVAARRVHHALRSRERGRDPSGCVFPTARWSRWCPSPAREEVPGGGPRVRPRHRQALDAERASGPLRRRAARPRAGSEPRPRARRTRWRSPVAARPSCRPTRASGRSSRRSVGTDTVRARWPLQVAVLDSLPV